MKCPKRWELDYVRGLRKFEQSIHTLFGTAFHETLQEYITIMYERSVKEADKLSLPAYLQATMMGEYKNSLEKNDNTHFATSQELQEFYYDGVAILDYIKKHRRVYFPSKQHELVGIEKPLNVPIRPGLVFKGFIDVIIKDNRDGRIKIIDIKTSTRGWNKYHKKDSSKTTQMLFYKKYYSQQYDVPIDLIDVEYLIVRRKIPEDSDFPIRRVQTFIPANGKTSMNKATKVLNEFVENCFTQEDEYKDVDHKAYKGSHCKFCPYVDDLKLCPESKRSENA